MIGEDAIGTDAGADSSILKAELTGFAERPEMGWQGNQGAENDSSIRGLRGLVDGWGCTC